MSIPIWPADLPQRVSRDGYGEAFADGRLQTKMDAGIPKTRRRFSAAPRPVQALIEMRGDGKARLERFWVEETKGGSIPFLMPDQSYNGLGMLATDTAPLTDEEGQPLLIESWWLCLFGEAPPSEQNLGGPWWRVSLTLSILPT